LALDPLTPSQKGITPLFRRGFEMGGFPTLHFLRILMSAIRKITPKRDPMARNPGMDGCGGIVLITLFLGLSLLYLFHIDPRGILGRIAWSGFHLEQRQPLGDKL
jgi:hypothetical protein